MPCSRNLTTRASCAIKVRASCKAVPPTYLRQRLCSSQTRRVTFPALIQNTRPVIFNVPKLTLFHSENSARLFGTTSSDHDATIFALSTAPGRAAIAIVRCSGPACLDIYSSLCPQAPPPKPRYATLRKLYAPRATREILDPGALVLYFPGPSTVTGEDVLELHLHGGKATVKAVLAAVSSISTPSTPIRPAEPGEFTQRAFYNGRLDLTQVEALGDTLAAETETQRVLAAQGAGGSSTLRSRYDNWREQLLQARGELEALIDFSEDQHFDESPVQLAQSVAAKVRALLTQLDASLQNAARGELLRNGIKVALLGAPNVGKSSLLNRIVGREAAIVSSIAGTTRDVVETNVDINGFFCNFGDLAGIRGGNEAPSTPIDQIDEVEQEGIRRAKARAMEADVVLVVRAIERREDGSLTISHSPELEAAVKELDPERQKIIHVINKVDLLRSQAPLDAPNAPERQLLNASTRELAADGKATVSMVTCDPQMNTTVSDGIQALLQQLTAALRALTEAVEIPGIATPTSSGYEESLGASERQARLLADCRDCLSQFLQTVDAANVDVEDDIDIVLAAEDLREAARCLAKITGQGESSDVEDVLGVVFENFCVGK